MGTEADKRAIDNLHATGTGIGQANYRDASKPPWKSPHPTRIYTPAELVQGPFAGRRLRETIGSTSRASSGNNCRTGNFTANQTVLGKERTKKAKLDRRPALKESRYFGDSARTARRASAPNPDIIDITDIEDTGELIPRPKQLSDRRSSSEDPIDVIGRSPEVGSLYPSTIRRSLGSTSAGPNERRLPRDGSATLRLQQRHKQKTNLAPTIDLSAEDDHDSIESASGFDDIPEPESKSTALDIKPGTVANRISEYEQKGKVQQSRSPSRPSSAMQNTRDLPTDNVPRINFFKQGVKAGMKPKVKSLQQVTQRPDGHPPQSDILTMSSGFAKDAKRSPKGRRTSSPTKSPDILLPLSQWARGLEIFGEDNSMSDVQFWLRYSPERKVLTIHEHNENGKSSGEFPLERILKSFKYTDRKTGNLNTIIIQVETQPVSSRSSLQQSEHFHQGSRGIDGKIVFKFSSRHPNLHNFDGYDLLVREWKRVALRVDGSGESVVPEAAKSIWENILRARDFSGSTDSTSDAIRALEKRAEAPIRATSAVANTVAGPSTRTRAKTAVSDNHSGSPALDPDELLLVYPPSGTGAVNLTRGDIQRLEPGQYLNDNLIEFGLKLWLNNLREEDPKLAEQVHIFNSFFYKKIHVKSKEEGYKSVRKWTTKFDLFKKKYIIVPINEHMHWYLTIICNPEFVLKPPPLELPKVSPRMQTRKRKRDGESNEDGETDSPRTTTPSPPEGPRDSAGSPQQRSGSEGTVEQMLVTCSISQENNSDGESTIALAGSDSPELQYPYDEPMDIDLNEHLTNLETETRRPSSPLSAPPSDIIDVDTMDKEDDMIVSETEGPPETKSSSVPVTRFYGSSRKGKEKVTVATSIGIESPHRHDTDMEQMSLDQEVETSGAPAESTYIFTFDSLGTKHPSAITTLQEYLKMEAKDKKDLDPSLTSSVVGKAALVPAQPNFCDCGVYLIHFVEVFMKDPIRLSEIILTKKPRDYDLKEREKDWDAEVVAGLRERLHQQIEDLSAKWKEQRSTKEKEKQEQQKKDIGETPGPSGIISTVEESDDEIVVGEVVSKAPAKKTTNKAKAQSAKTGETRAARLR